MKKLILVVVFILCLGIYPEKSFAIDTKQYSNEEISKLDENSKEKIYHKVKELLLLLNT